MHLHGGHPFSLVVPMRAQRINSDSQHVRELTAAHFDKLRRAAVRRLDDGLLRRLKKKAQEFRLVVEIIGATVFAK